MAWEARLDGAVYGQSESVAGAVLRAEALGRAAVGSGFVGL